jgi:hypothetical protein
MLKQHFRRMTLYIFVLMVLIATASLVAFDFYRHRSAKKLLEGIQTLNLDSTAADAVRFAKQFKAKYYVRKHIEEGGIVSDEFVPVPVTECDSGECELSFGSDPDWPTQVFAFLWEHPKLRRWLPASYLWVNVRVHQGRVRAIQTTFESWQESDIQRVRVELASDVDSPRWNTTRYTAFNTGGPIGARTTATYATTFTAASYERRKWAFDYDLKCLRAGKSCSRCEIAPRICDDYEHGDWNYFEIPPPVLAEFREAVNKLPFGISEGEVVKRLGRERGQYSDRLPFDFPEGTVFGGDNTLSYLLKMHRDRDAEPYESVVIFRFNDEVQLVGIESTVAGVHSRLLDAPHIPPSPVPSAR